MDKNTVIGFLLIGVVLIGYSILSKPSKEEVERAIRKRDSIAQIQRQIDSLEKQKEALQGKGTSEEKEDDIVRAYQDTTFKDSVIQKKKQKPAQEEKFGVFAHSAAGKDSFIILENKLIKAKIAQKGGKISSVELKDYKTYGQEPLLLFTGDSTVFGFKIFASGKNIHTNQLFFKPVKKVTHIKATEEEKQLKLRLYATNESYIEYIYTIYPDRYMIDFDAHFIDMDKIIASNYNTIEMEWEIYLPQLERARKNENNYSTIFYKYFHDDVDKLKSRSSSEQEENLANKVKWIAFKHQFFSSVLIAEPSFNYANINYVPFEEEDSQDYIKRCRANMHLTYNGKDEENFPFHFYFGPNHFNTLKKYGNELEELVTVGGSFLRWINRFIIIPIFNWLDNFIGNYGIIILLLTIIIKVALLPLTYRSFLSQAKMKVLKPQIEEINKKYPKGKEMDKQKATMALYKKAGANPMGGCLPLLLQMPILLAMYRFFPTSIELRQESFLWAKDLSTYDALIHWETNIPIISSIFHNHISLFTLLMAITTFISMNTNTQATASSGQMQSMKMMKYFMPIMLLVVLNNFSAGLTYYLFLANLITLGQNNLFKLFINEEELLNKMESKKKKPQKKSKFQSRLEEMAKQRGHQLPKKKK